jgi:hypothetical protein
MRLTATLRYALALCLILFLGSPLAADDASGGKAVDHSAPKFLDQGWTPAEREEFYYTPQGSQLIPYEWFLVLEQKGNHKLFRENANLDRLRYVISGRSDRNQDGLPVGFVKDADIDASQTASKLAYLQQKFGKKPRDASKHWLGLTCAACHTNRIEHNGKVFQVDGAPTMGDLQTFLVELADAVDATHKDDAKLKRFAHALGAKAGPALKAEVAAHAEALKELVHRNHSGLRYGYARLDAFGAILNAVCDSGLGLPANRVEANAPVSYPFLWDTPHMDWVQWNSSSDIPLGRNVGEVLGVFGMFTLKTDDVKQQQFSSTVRLKSLIHLESLLSKLKAPAWPQELGALDEGKMKLGRQLYMTNCAKCHQVRKADGNFEMVTLHGQQRIKTVAVPLPAIKTDPQMIKNLGAKADPGVLRSLLPPDPTNGPVPRPVLLSLTVGRVTVNRAAEEAVTLPASDAAVPPPFGGAGYKARSLEGIWATAPYLHNGSVPNLYEVLLPSAKRSKSFYVGSRKFDSQKVGFVTEQSPGAFEFKTADENGPIAGNSNVGHEGHSFTEVLENGAWREFNDDERWALAEFMKSLAQPVANATAMVKVEEISKTEPAQIDNIVALTIQQLKNRYSGDKPVLRGVHAKDHGCVQAEFKVAENLAPEYRVGPFATPGQVYKSVIRFSNASTLVLPDNSEKDGKTVFGSRGMAVKLMDVKGVPLIPDSGAIEQDFLMVNHPVFAFANVDDYEVLSTVLADLANMERPDKFFGIQLAKGGAAADRAKKSLTIVGRIQAVDVASGAFQAQPATPVDCRYFSGAPFLFGDGYAMKYSAVPADPAANPMPKVADKDYLRDGLIKRLAVGDTAKPVVFTFKVQRREIKSLNIASDIEDACTEWPEATYPFVEVATITILPQGFDSPEQRAACEKLIFTPWHGVEELRPLGGINRMRRAVYEASSSMRHQSKAPAAGGTTP